MQVKAVAVRALLPVQKVRTIFRGTERGSKHAFVQHELVDREDSGSTLTRRGVRDVGAVARPYVAFRIVHVVHIYDDFSELP